MKVALFLLVVILASAHAAPSSNLVNKICPTPACDSKEILLLNLVKLHKSRNHYRPTSSNLDYAYKLKH